MTLPTVRANNGTFANFGSVVIQAQQITRIAQAVQQQITTLTTPNQGAVVPVRQAVLPVQAIIHTPDTASKLVTTNLTEVTHALVNNPHLIIPIPAQFNNIMPTFS